MVLTTMSIYQNPTLTSETLNNYMALLANMTAVFKVVNLESTKFLFLEVLSDSKSYLLYYFYGDKRKLEFSSY